MNFVKNFPRIHGDATVIARTVIDFNSQRRAPKQLFPSSRTIVERNGKQFRTEIKERIERRYVQIFDENLGRMRFFEVTDYIPTRIIQPVPKRVSAIEMRSNLRNFQNFREKFSSFDFFFDRVLI